jgi:predicted nuclease of predicted toxin-antitoxin system
MKFLADANIAPRTIEALRQADFNVKSISEEGQGEISDEMVIKLAIKKITL